MRRAVPLLLLALAACRVDRETPRPRAGVAPVIVVDAGPAIDPLAQQVCDLVWTLPASRKAACCVRPVQATEAAPCARVLTDAIRAEAVSIEAARLGTCEGELERELQDCDWVTRGLPEIPPLCAEGLVQGRRGEGERCASSLECGGTLHCADADGGARCLRSQPAGGSCTLAHDALRALLRFGPDPLKHPCDGRCREGRCVQSAAEGDPCAVTAECGRGQHCADGHCLSGDVARLGEPCSGGDCEPGERCLEGACRALLNAGAACTSSEQCLGVCQASDGGARCAIRCD